MDIGPLVDVDVGPAQMPSPPSPVRTLSRPALSSASLSEWTVKLGAFEVKSDFDDENYEVGLGAALGPSHAFFFDSHLPHHSCSNFYINKHIVILTILFSCSSFW